MSDELRDFEKQVRDRSKEVPVLVDFWAPWCGPCRTLGPVLERMATQTGGRWELVKVNTEEHQDLAAKFNIASIPAVKLFVNGEVVDEFVGALSEREIRRFLEKALPSPSANQMAEAQRLMKASADGAAAKMLESVIAAEPANHEARVLLAQAVLSSDPNRIQDLLMPVGADSELNEKANALRTLARLAQLPAQPSAMPPAKVRERYLAGTEAVRTSNFETALQSFIEVLEHDKLYDNGGAREACKAIFTLLGLRHPLSERFFRAFSSALHS